MLYGATSIAAGIAGARLSSLDNLCIASVRPTSDTRCKSSMVG